MEPSWGQRAMLGGPEFVGSFFGNPSKWARPEKDQKTDIT